MKLTKDRWLGRAGGWMSCKPCWTLGCVLLALALAAGEWAGAQAVSTTTVQGTVYLANGQVGSGTLTVSWPSFTTANGLAVAAGRTTVAIAPDGFVSVNLTPNVGALPAGLFYTAVFQMSDGTVNTEYWVVPAAAQATLAAVQAQVMPAAQAVQAVSKAYVDQSIAELTGSLLTASGGSLSGNLYLNADPTAANQAATKHYVDTQVGTAVPLAGGAMTGALQTPTVNGVQAPATGSAQTTLQAAMNAAGTNGAMEIPPTYAGTDGFTNPNGVYVKDMRTTGSQQTERSVKEFGAVCDGTTDDTNALQTALNYAYAHKVALTIPQGTCKTRTLNWHGESIGGLGKQVSALMGFPGQDVLETTPDSTTLLSYTRIHDLTIYVDQSVDTSCAAAAGRAAAGTCALNRPMESNSIFAPGGNGQTGAAGTGTAWAVGNCAIAMPAATGAGGNGLKVAEMENVEIAATGTDPLQAQYPGAHSTHTCGLYLAQWPRWSEFRNVDISGVNTGVAIPALPGTTPAGLNADSNRWQNVTIQATHAFTEAAGSNNVLDNVVAMAGNSAATGEPPTGLVLDLPLNSTSSGQGWTVRNAVVMPSWVPVEPQLTVTAAGGAVTAVTAGPEMGLGFDPYGTTVPVIFSGSCTAQATAAVNANGSIGAITVTQGGVGCSTTTTASIGASGNWDTAAPVNLIGGQNMTFYAGNLLKGTGGYTVWNATGSGIYGTQLDGGGGNLPGGGSYAALVANSRLGTTLQVDEFPGVDFGAKLQACVNAVNAQYGGDCDARNFTGTLAMGSNVTISTPNTTVQLPCATIATANQMIVTAGTRNVVLHGCSLRGASTASGSQGGTVFLYSGTGAMIEVGDPTYAANTMGFHLDNVVVNTTSSSSATAEGLAAYRTQEMDLESLYFMGNANQTGMTLDGTGNYTGGTFYDNAFNGFQTAVNAIGHQVANPATTDWMNASTFVRLHIDCPTSGGNPISGTYGINLQQGDGNTFTGGDVEGCATALHLGANAQNNTIVGLRNENSTNQVVADAGSSYNNWMTGGTMFTGALTDNGTRNSFMDSFHRSFNGMKGDYYGSQQDATVTNHYRLGIGTGNERGLLDEYQTDYGYRWTTGLTDATGGEQYYEIQDQLNNVNRLSIGQYNNGQPSTNNQTVINAAGTGAVVLNGSNNAGTGGVQFGSGGANETTVASISNAGNAQFNGTLAVGGATTFSATPTVKNQADAEIDTTLQAGLTASQKESVIYKDWNGNSQWYAEKDASNNWELNSATGGLDSFKAYQSTNSGDTYINASNGTGAVRINYETGAGTAFNIYGGNSSTLYASFTGTTSIKFPGLAAGSGHNCLQIDNSGFITNTGVACGTGNGNGTVGSGNTGQIAYYSASGTAVTGLSTVPLTAGGTGSTTASGALTSLGAFAYPGGTGIPFGLTASTARQATAADVTTLMGYTPLKPANNLSDVSSPSTALTNLGAQAALGYTPLKPANNLSDVSSPSTALTNLGAVPAAGGTMSGALTAPQFNGALNGNASTATALAATPTQCATNKYATGVSANGAATCTQVTYTQLSGTVPTWNQNTTGTAANVTGTVALTNGGTGATTASGALTNLLPGVTADGANGFGVTGNVQTGGTLQVTGATTFAATPTVKNQADAEIDAALQAGLTASQKESVIYNDWNGASQWYAEKDASNNWELNSGVGGLDSFKAYQSTNSGDTYVNASNPTGTVRVNYETGSGTAFDVYNGNNGTLLASFAAPGSVEFPSLAAGSGHNCLQVDSSGYITNTGSACGSATGGNNITVSSATAGAVAYYAGNGTSISGMTSVPVVSGGTGATTASAALTNLGALASNGATSTGSGLANVVTFPGTVAAGTTILASGPYTDIRYYAPAGASLCTGSAQPLSSFFPSLAAAQAVYPFVTALTQTADYAAIQKAVNAWVLSGGVLIFPSAQKCVINTGVSVVFSQSNSTTSPYIVDLRGSILSSQLTSSSPFSLGFSISGTGNIFITHLLVENGLISDSGNAAVTLSFNGAGNTNNGYLSDVETRNLRVVHSGATIGIQGTTIFQSHFMTTTVQDANGSISGSHNWDFENGPVGSQQSGDITLDDCEGQSADVNVYSNIQGDLKIKGGTYLQSLEQAIYTTGGSLLYVHAAHLENQYYNNTSGPSVRPKISCSSAICDIGGDRAAVDSGTDNSTTVAFVYSSVSTNKANLSVNDTSSGGSIQQATIDITSSGGSATLTAIAPSQVTLQGSASYLTNVTSVSGASGVSTPSVTTQSVSTQSLTVNGVPITTGNSGVPAWLQNLGTGSEGAETCSSGTLSGDHNYTTFTVPSGDTCTVSNTTGLVIHATGACTINGTITAAGNSAYVYTGPFGTGGGGGGGTGAGTAAAANYLFPGNSNTTAVSGGTAGAASGGPGGTGNQPSSSYWNTALNSGFMDGTVWVGGAGGAGAGGAAGGYGSPGILLICGSITGTGTINTSGTSGANAALNNAGGGGGGAAGPIVLSSQQSETFSLTILQTGGAGGTCGSYTGCGPGGAGAAGMLAEYQGW